MRIHRKHILLPHHHRKPTSCDSVELCVIMSWEQCDTVHSGDIIKHSSLCLSQSLYFIKNSLCSIGNIFVQWWLLCCVVLYNSHDDSFSTSCACLQPILYAYSALVQPPSSLPLYITDICTYSSSSYVCQKVSKAEANITITSACLPWPPSSLCL